MTRSDTVRRHVRLVSLTMNPSVSKPKKRFIGTKSGPKPGIQRVLPKQIPLDILQDEELNIRIRSLPSNYTFEIHKTVHHVRKNQAKMVALQLPEGLQMYACTIADIIEQ